MRRLLVVGGAVALLAATARHRPVRPRRVALTFRDGSSVELDPASPQARQLQDLAVRLRSG